MYQIIKIKILSYLKYYPFFEKNTAVGHPKYPSPPKIRIFFMIAPKALFRSDHNQYIEFKQGFYRQTEF